MLPRAGIRLCPAGRAELRAAYGWVDPPSEFPKPCPTHPNQPQGPDLVEATRPYRGLLSSTAWAEGHGHWTRGQAERPPVNTDLWLHHHWGFGLVCMSSHLFCVCILPSHVVEHICVQAGRPRWFWAPRGAPMAHACIHWVVLMFAYPPLSRYLP